jgi:hypothetical protein
MAEFPPQEWEIFKDSEFELAAPRQAGEHVMELMAQARPNGRCVDHWRVAIGGGKVLQADFRLADICRSSQVSPYKIRFQAWPRDVKLRRNMVSSAWMDGQTLLARREFAVFKMGSDEACPEDEILQELAKEEDLSKKSFSVRFAVAAGVDGSLLLELQGLPAAEATLLSKPAFLG